MLCFASIGKSRSNVILFSRSLLGEVNIDMLDLLSYYVISQSHAVIIWVSTLQEIHTIYLRVST